MVYNIWHVNPATTPLSSILQFKSHFCDIYNSIQL